jgi:hypothetical protein
MTPGIHPHNVNKNTINIDPQPISMTDNGGKMIANKTLSNDIIVFFMFAKIMNFIVKIRWNFNACMEVKKQEIIIVLFDDFC